MFLSELNNPHSSSGDSHNGSVLLRGTALIILGLVCVMEPVTRGAASALSKSAGQGNQKFGAAFRSLYEEPPEPGVVHDLQRNPGRADG